MDDELRARFAELRELDEAGAPEFQAMRQVADGTRETTASRARRSLVEWTAAAAGIMLATGAAVSVARRHESQTVVPASVASISTWRSPTASLLRTSSISVLERPSIIASVLDGVTGPVMTGKENTP
jgi:hypothetical protein